MTDLASAAVRRPVPRSAAAPCYHGGAFFDAIGSDFRELSRRHAVIAADVLDAWFDPSPVVTAAVSEALPWLLRTSPPTQAEGLVATIAAARGLDPDAIAVGAGSSDLIFRCFLAWLTPRSRVLLPDPSYGEYAHVLTHVVGCRVTRFPLSPSDGWRIDPRAFAAAASRHDLAIVVNPNNPTGRHLRRRELAAAVAAAPDTRFWIDEAYIGYVGDDESLERMAAARDNLVVCKSLSKAYALSGARAAYLTAHRDLVARVRALTPPWVIGLPSQVAACAALSDPSYYRTAWQRTHRLRRALVTALRHVDGLRVEGSDINLVLVRLAPWLPDAATVAGRMRARDVFVRDLANLSPAFGDRTLRIAVKDAHGNARVVAALAAALDR